MLVKMKYIKSLLIKLKKGDLSGSKNKDISNLQRIKRNWKRNERNKANLFMV